MLYVHFSNQYESLADPLVDKLGGTRGDVFARDQVIVPSAAVQRATTHCMTAAGVTWAAREPLYHYVCAAPTYVCTSR